MRAFVQIARLLVRSAPWAIARGALLALLVLLMGSALLGLSGWFITAAGMAGLAGIGIAFDVFRPSAGVRFLALGRTAARYGERLLTHDATLRAIAALRIDLLRRQLGRGIRAMETLRSEAMLTRIVSDVDALDGIVLRLLLCLPSRRYSPIPSCLSPRLACRVDHCRDHSGPLRPVRNDHACLAGTPGPHALSFSGGWGAAPASRHD
jgi:ABC-type transport system involved in cytochrome bd biosynthesis fused ATPase/permease subunit